MNLLRHPATIIVLILLIVLLFGSHRLPDVARSLGQSLKTFKGEVRELQDDDAPRDTSKAAADGTVQAQPAPRLRPPRPSSPPPVGPTD